MTLLALMLAAANVVHAADKPAADIDGKKIFNAKCVSCHAATGKGNPAMAKMFKVEPAKLDLTVYEGDIVKAVADGNGKMPAFKGKLKEDEIAAVSKYVATLKGGEKPKADKPAPKKNAR